MKKYLPWIVLFCSVIVSLSAAFYSVFGLAKLFSGAYNNVLFMAGSLEFSKLVITAYLHEYWNRLGKGLKTYLTAAVIILALITSAGIYGFLSDAYQKTALQDKFHTEKTNLIAVKKQRFESQLLELKNERNLLVSNIQVLSKSLSTDNQVQTLDKRTGKVLTQIQSSNKTGVQKQLESENKRRELITSRIDNIQDSIQKYEMLKIESESNNDAGSELGPLKYISGLTGVSMDRVVNWVLLLIIFVFDPLAIALVISALFAFKLNENKPTINTQVKEDIAVQGEISRNTTPDIIPIKKNRGRPKGTKNKLKNSTENNTDVNEGIAEKIEEILKKENNVVAEPNLTTEVVRQISASFPSKKNFQTGNGE